MDSSEEQTRHEREPLPRNVKVLSAVSLAQDAGSEMLYPFLPRFITGVLGAPVVAVGLAEGLADAASAVTKLVAGRATRTGRRRPWIAAGYGLATVGKLIVALALVWPIVIVGRVVDRLGKGIRGVPRDAMIADAVHANQRGRAFGFHRAMDTAGAVIGPLLGLGLYELLDRRIRPVLFLALIPAAISTALVWLVREDRRVGRRGHILRRSAAKDATPAPTGAAPQRHPLGPRFWRVMVPMTVFAAVNSTDALLLQRAGDLGLSLTSVVLVYVLYNVVYAALGYPAGALADRWSPRWLFAAGLAVFAAVYIGLGYTHSASVVWVLLPLYGAYTALTDGVGKAWIAGLSGSTERAWALGVHSSITGVGVLVAGLWSGLAWGSDGRIPLTLAGLVALVVAAWLTADGVRRPT